MKKIVVLILCINLVIINVNAETFYTDYKISEIDSEVLSEENDLTKVVQKDAYNNYKINEINLGYYEEGYNLENAYCDLNNFIIEKEVIKNSNSLNQLHYITNSIYQSTKGRYIRIRNFRTTGILKSIEFYYENEIINYNIIERNYVFGDIFNYDTSIVFDLYQSYSLDKLTIKFVFEQDAISQLIFTLDVYEKTYLNQGVPYTDYTISFQRVISPEIMYLNFVDSESFINLLKKTTWIYESEYRYFKSISYYLKINILYRYYTKNKEYLNIYTEEAIDGYNLDYSDHKNLYDYYYRDYIEVLDNIENKADLANFIVSTSLPIDDIKVLYNYNQDDKNDVTAIIKYKEYTFFKKIKFTENEEEIDISSQDDNSHLFTNIKAIDEEISNEVEIVESNNNEELENKTIVINNQEKQNNKNSSESKDNKIIENNFKQDEEIIINNQDEDELIASINNINYKNDIQPTKYSKYLLLVIILNIIIILLLIMCKYFKKIHKK